ncbi:MAG: hypothetical protein C5S49_00760 [Candidatus Methanogaster sp.]|nr:MAG: hypothetical protein C5S49_00760 [ANME-2 cluster archaeon]
MEFNSSEIELDSGWCRADWIETIGGTYEKPYKRRYRYNALHVTYYRILAYPRLSLYFAVNFPDWIGFVFPIRQCRYSEVA